MSVQFAHSSTPDAGAKDSSATSGARKSASKLLRILPDGADLRGDSPFLAPQSWPPSSVEEAPRALRALAQIIDGGLCHRCGSCVGICPTRVLGRDVQDYPRVDNLAACTDCDLCVKVCPGDELAYGSLTKQMYGEATEPEMTHGSFVKGAIAYATDPWVREHSTSGGAVTALLVDLLERREIDGALVIGSDDEVLWKGRPFIARSREDLLAAMKSKYAISPTNIGFQEIREVPGRYAVVGLPCQIHGVVKARTLDPQLRERITLTIGLFCHAAIEHEAFEVLWQHLGEHTKGARRFISRIGKHPGTPYLEKEDGTLYPVYFGSKKGYRPSSIEMINILYRLYTPQRCLTCFDSTSEFADIAVGDPWMAPPEDDVNFYQGWSFVIVRSARGLEVLNRLAADGKMHLRDLTTAETLASNRMMATEKRWRAFRVIETLRRQGRPTPSYDIVTPRHPFKEFLKTEVHMLTHIMCYLPGVRRWVLECMLSEVGYQLLRLNSWRRRFREWRRDTASWLRRKSHGRR